MDLTREGKIDLPSDPFWDFSLTVYDRPGVADVCLRLQDRHGIDVNMLLFAVFAGRQGVTLDDLALQAARDSVSRWQAEVVAPLRALRRSIKEDSRGAPPVQAEALRQRLGTIELAAEHIEQLMLGPLLPPVSDGSGARQKASQNVQVYLELLGVRPSAEDRDALALIISAGIES